jgi:hypothetical protein
LASDCQRSPVWFLWDLHVTSLPTRIMRNSPNQDCPLPTLLVLAARPKLGA